VRPKLVVGSAIACVASVAIAAFVFELRLERAIVLAPVIVVCFGALIGLFALWTRVAWESIKRRRHPWRIVAGGVVALLLLVVLSLFVGPLPHE
jgi:hypothetical protein